MFALRIYKNTTVTRKPETNNGYVGGAQMNMHSVLVQISQKKCL